MSERPFAWERSYPAGLAWDVPIKASTLPAIFTEAVGKYRSLSAIDFRGVTLSFADLDRQVERAAAAFLNLGYNRHKPLAIYLPNVPYHPIAFFGAAKAGIPVVHLSPLDAERELAHKIGDSGARAIITANFPGLLDNALKLLEKRLVDLVIAGDDAVWGPSAIPLVSVPARADVLSFGTLIESAALPSQWPEVTPSSVALLQYTGGTTGLPKGAVLTHANLTSALAIYEAADKAMRPERNERDKIICVLPLFHIYALTTVLLRHIQAGSLIMLRIKFDPEQALHDIEVNRATLFPGVPTMWIALANHPDIHKRDLSSLTFCGSGGAPLPVEVQTRFAQLTGVQLKGGWGMTETSPAGTFVPLHGSPPPGTIGLPLPGIEMDVVALDNPRRKLGAGEIGELRIKGPNVMQGYWKRPKETAEVLVDGYLLTGDIGYMDRDGFFFIVDRKKDMIISGGFNVYPQMIEQAIYEHPSVEEVLVIGVPDAYRGEVAKAFVKLKSGQPAFTLDELKLFLADKIGRHEMPAYLEIRDALPRTAVGKLSKSELREEERLKRQAELQT